MKKKFLIPFLLCCTLLTAEESAFKKVQNAHSNFSSIEGNFQQDKYLRDLNIHLDSQGKFKITKEMLLWEQSKPSQSKIELSKEGLKLDSKKIHQNKQNPIFSEIFNCMLFLDNECLEKHFLSSLKEKNNKDWQLKLSPKSELIKKAIASIDIEGNDQVVEKIKITEQNKNTSEITFSRVKRK